jgi:hypothetical protein
MRYPPDLGVDLPDLCHVSSIPRAVVPGKQQIGPIDPLAVHHGSSSLIHGLLKWLCQTLDRAPWLMALEPGGIPPLGN